MFALHFRTDGDDFGGRTDTAQLRDHIAELLEATAKNVRLGMGGNKLVVLHDRDGQAIGEWKILGHNSE